MNGLTIACDDGSCGELARTGNTELAVSTEVSASAAVVVVGVGIDFFAVAKRHRIVCSRRASTLVAILSGTAVVAASAAIR